MCSVCVCVCVSVPPEIPGIGGRIAMLLTPSWRSSPGELHKLLFEPIWHGLRVKAFGSFSPVTRRIPCTYSTVTFPVTLGRMNLDQYNKAFETFSKGMHLRTCPLHRGQRSCYCFLREWAIGTPCEQVTDISPSVNRKTNPFMNRLRLVIIIFSVYVHTYVSTVTPWVMM